MVAADQKKTQCKEAEAEHIMFDMCLLYIKHTKHNSPIIGVTHQYINTKLHKFYIFFPKTRCLNMQGCQKLVYKMLNQTMSSQTMAHIAKLSCVDKRKNTAYHMVISSNP